MLMGKEVIECEDCRKGGEGGSVKGWGGDQ